MTQPTDTPLHERLTLMVEHSLPGTLIPVDSLRALLIEDRLPKVSVPGMSLEEVAARCAGLGARSHPVKPSAVRKWIRTGLWGVKLTAFPWGKSFRVDERALEEFVLALENAPRGARHGGDDGEEELGRLDAEIAESRRRVPKRKPNR